MNKNTMYKLDNAAKIYPASMTKTKNAVYRVSVYLKSDINPSVLKKAVADLAPRFPTYYVQLFNGFMWDYLKPVDNYDIVIEETESPCRPIKIGNFDTPLFRVLYKENKISVEFFHSITDGTGASVYIKTLTGRYLELLGHNIEKTCGVLDINDLPNEAEISDDFQRVYNKKLHMSRKEENAYQFKPETKENFLAVTSGVIPMNLAKAVIKAKYKCTVTEYLAGVYAYSFLQQYLKDNSKSKKHCVKISIPVNLRPYFDSQTLRNFAAFVNVSIDPRTCTELTDIIKCVSKQMNEMITKENLEKFVSQNVAEEKMLISRLAPNKLKKPFMKAGFMLYGERKYSSVLSNIGLMKVPASMEQFIERFEFIIGETTKNRVSATAVGFKNNLTVTISAVTENTEIQDFFFDTIRKDGIEIEEYHVGSEIKNRKKRLA